MNGDDHQRGMRRAAVATTIAGACLWLVATAFTITELGVVVGLVLWVWGVPAAAIAVCGLALWCRHALARRRARPDEQRNVALAPAAS